MPARELLSKWFSFYNEESCGKCTPCRLGTFQLYRMIEDEKEIPWDEIVELLETLETTSFCALGRSVSKPVKNYISNILKQ
jgi:NADH:ubiquinone oxidoreductase subunit F (NADH-binding)